MDALQAVSAATQIVASMVSAIGALDQASRNLDEAPKRIRSLEEFVYQLEKLAHQSRQKHSHKLHNPRLDHQIQSLNALIEKLHPNIMKARKIVSKNKLKNFARVVWNSMAGDPLGKTLLSIRADLNWWLETQRFTEDVENIIEKAATSVPIRLKIKADQGYPISSKCNLIRSLLEQQGSHHVVLIVGLSGIGKSCLARQVASDLPSKFVDGAAELGFGQWCSKAACNGDKAEYQKRLAKRLQKFLLQIGYKKKIRNEISGDVDYICCLLQEALYGKHMLILLDDVWEQDIVECFAKLYDNGCKYLVTTRIESVYEITEAEKVELSKDDVRGISKAILLYHSLLGEDELPAEAAEMLLERCGHHPLTVAVMGKALRKEIRAEKWEKAISNLSTYATCAPGPISYANEKAEDTVTIFGSFEFSLEVMPSDSRSLFISLASLSWVEPIPEACLEAIWSVLGQDSLFSLTVSKLVEGSLLMKMDSDLLYQVHDMVSLYLDGKSNDSVKMLLSDSTTEGIALISPWLCIFGKDSVKYSAEQKVEFFLSLQEEKLAVISLRSIIQALMASISVSDLEASRAGFSRILGPKIANLLSGGSHDLVAVSSMAITNIFSRGDYSEYLLPLESISVVDKLATVLDNCEDPMIQTSVLTVQAKLAELGSADTIDEILERIPMNQVAHLLSPDTESWHDCMFSILMSLIKAGKAKAVERMFAFEIDKSLIRLLDSGSDIEQHHAIVILKALYELGGPAKGSLRPNTLNMLPWQARMRLEKFVFPEQHTLPSPRPQSYEDIIHKVVDSDDRHVLGAMQDLIPITEKAGDPRIADMILHSPLTERLSEILQNNSSDSLKSESAFILMKLACSGGEAFIKKFLGCDIIPELIKMMQRNVAELQDSAYTALHQMLYSDGGVLVLNQIFKLGLFERLLHSVESKSAKTREVSLHCILDLVEVGNKTSLERMFSLQVVEKLVKIEKDTGGSSKTVVDLLKGISKCKNLTTADRWVMKQQVVKKAKTALKGHRLETKILAAIDAFMSEGSKGASTSSHTRRRK